TGLFPVALELLLVDRLHGFRIDLEGLCAELNEGIDPLLDLALLQIVLARHVHDGLVTPENLQHDLPFTIGCPSSLDTKRLDDFPFHHAPPFQDQIYLLLLVQSSWGSL
ncbi:hypothetical protein SAMN05660836_01797, partial [Thermodesulforhabdus norvegica]